ncbi:MAG: XdhC family protein, partial [Colwelliaceae bacterium]|nr:XdhC family protein [Colwelliaceae bacterium]
CRKRNERLINYIDNPESLDKMHSPVGLDIGSKTPFEIAISVLAHVIQKRSQLESRQSK